MEQVKMADRSARTPLMDSMTSDTPCIMGQVQELDGALEMQCENVGDSFFAWRRAVLQSTTATMPWRAMIIHAHNFPLLEIFVSPVEGRQLFWSLAKRHLRPDEGEPPHEVGACSRTQRSD